MVKLLLSRLFLVLDLLLGVAGGAKCPNCGGPKQSNKVIARRRLGLLTIRSCKGCGILYRPAGWRGGPALEFYYSLLYGNAGIATEPRDYADQRELAVDVRAAGKDRSQLLAGTLAGWLPRRLCVFGCSWGYELLPLRELATEVIGVELSGPRREFGLRSLGLDIYPTVEAAANECGPAEVVISSHVLEHIPQLEMALDAIRQELNPTLQIHIAPNVDSSSSLSQSSGVVGREHPIGVASAFWQRYAAKHGLSLETFLLGEAGGPGQVERVAILRSPGGQRPPRLKQPGLA